MELNAVYKKVKGHSITKKMNKKKWIHRTTFKCPFLSQGDVP